MQSHQRHSARSVAAAFTLVELLVVIGIVAILMGILIPVIARARVSAQEAATQNFLNGLAGAVQRYHDDFRAYPGPLRNDEIYSAYQGGGVTPATTAPLTGLVIANAAGFAQTSTPTTITMSENLVLGLLGGLRLPRAGEGNNVVVYDPSNVGMGPAGLNPLNPKRYNAYTGTQSLSWRTEGNVQTGHYKDALAEANDSIIPEFVDQIGLGMPILYLRARPGVAMVSVAASISNTNNSVITNGQAPRSGPYDLSQILGYTGSFTGAWPSLTVAAGAPPAGKSIGAEKSAPKNYYNGSATPVNYGSVGPYHGLRTVNTAAVMGPVGTNHYYPYDAFPYFTNPGIANTPRSKDGFMLVSAGRDRIYGTNDDICSFGAVKP